MPLFLYIKGGVTLSLIIKNLNKRLICLILCICFLLPIFDTERYSAYAMDLVITPAVIAIICTGLFACGVVAQNGTDMQSIASNMWETMDHSLKTSIMAMSMAKEVVQDGVSVWARQVWLDFKASVSSLFASAGGVFNFSKTVSNELKDFPVISDGAVPPTVFLDKSGINLQNSVKYVNGCYYIYSTSGTLVTDYVGFMLPIGFKNYAFKGSSGRYQYCDSSGVSIPVPSPFWKSDGLIYISPNASNLLVCDIVEYSRDFLTGRVSVSEVKGGLKKFGDKLVIANWKNEVVDVLCEVPHSFTLEQAFQKFAEMPVTKSISVPYTVDALYYPVGTNSVCPDVPMDKVMSLPLVNVGTAAIPVSVPKDVAGSISFKDVPAVVDPTIPVDPSIPVVPPVVPDVSIDAKKIDWSPLMSANFSKVFPFCIPFDFVRLIKGYASAPKEPDFSININTKYLKIKHTINKEPIMLPVKFFRTFAIFAFILLLINKTRDMMKW